MVMRKIAMAFTSGAAAAAILLCGTMALAAPTPASPADQAKPSATQSNTTTSKPGQGHPGANARVVKTGTIHLQCPAGTDKYCDGNVCKCWTRND